MSCKLEKKTIEIKDFETMYPIGHKSHFYDIFIDNKNRGFISIDVSYFKHYEINIFAKGIGFISIDEWMKKYRSRYKDKPLVAIPLIKDNFFIHNEHFSKGTFFHPMERENIECFYIN